MTRRVLLDVCVPHRRRMELPRFEVQSARFAGFDLLKDGELLLAIKGKFDVLVTLDGSLAFQQNLLNSGAAVVLIRVSEQTPEAFRSLIPALGEAVDKSSPGAVSIVGL